MFEDHTFVKDIKSSGTKIILEATSDGKYIVNGANQKAEVWDIESGTCLHVLKEHESDIQSITLAANEKYIISGSGSHIDNSDIIKIWDLKTGALIQTLNEKDATYTVRVTADNKYLLSSTENKIKIWDISTLTEHIDEKKKKIKTVKELKGEGASKLEITSDSKYFITLPHRYDKLGHIIRIWDFSLKKVIRTLEGHTDKINAILITTDNQRIISCSDDNTIKIWDLATGKCIQTLEDHTRDVNAIALSSDGEFLISASEDNTLKTWDLTTGKCIRSSKGSTSINSIILNEKYIILADGAWKIKILDFIEGNVPEKYQGIELPKEEILGLIDLEKYLKTPIPMVEKIEWNEIDSNGKTIKYLNFGFIAENGHVTKLGLARNYRDKQNNLIELHALIDDLSYSIGNFKHLEYLNLNRNRLKIIPESFGNLTSLKYFEMTNQIFDTELPESFGNLKSLEHLNFGGSRVKQLPESFGNLTSLKYLYLYSSRVENLPTTFGNLKSLEKLHIFNHLVSLSENFGNLESLRELEITSSRDFQELPESFGNLKALENLVIKETRLNKLPESFGSLNSLKTLSLAENSLEKLPESLGNLQKIETMDLSKNLIETLPDSIGGLQSLQSLDLRNNNVKTLPESFGNLKKLHTLNLVFNKNLKTIPDSFGNLESLKFLSISGGDFQTPNILEFLPEGFGKLNNLQQLNLSSNNLSELPKSFKDLKSLQYLNLSNNKKLNILPESFEDLPNLSSCDFSFCGFTEIPAFLWRLPALTKLGIHNNPLNQEEQIIVQKDLADILAHLKKKSAIEIFISHAVADFETHKIKELSEFLEQQKEVAQAYYCEKDLVGNIDDFMNFKLPRCQMTIFIATQKSVFNSVDCAHELELSKKLAIQIIPVKSNEVSWENLAEIGLSRELGLEYDTENFERFCQDLTKYIYDYKRNIDVFEDADKITMDKARKKVVEEARVLAVEASTERKSYKRLREILQVTKALPIDRFAKILEMEEDILWDRVFGWAKDFGFTINGNQVEFEGGRINDFIAKLERDF